MVASERIKVGPFAHPLDPVRFTRQSCSEYTAPMSRDTQIVELAGRHWLIGQLLTFGLEVANPVRDRGVDLVVYEDRSDAFRASPVQIKASSWSGFSVHDKYKKTKDLLLAYVWSVRPDAEKTIAFVLTVDEAERVVVDMDWAREGKSGYTTTRATLRLRELLAPYISTEDRWRSLLRRESRTVWDSLSRLAGPGTESSQSPT